MFKYLYLLLKIPTQPPLSATFIAVFISRTNYVITKLAKLPISSSYGRIIHYIPLRVNNEFRSYRFRKTDQIFFPPCDALRRRNTNLINKPMSIRNGILLLFQCFSSVFFHDSTSNSHCTNTRSTMIENHDKDTYASSSKYKSC